jgi:hypothetical protein
VEYTKRQQELTAIMGKVAKIESEISSLETKHNVDCQQAPAMSDAGSRPGQCHPSVEESNLPKFSDFDDRDGYDGHFLSPYLIDDVLESDSQNHKPLQKARMVSLGGRILKLDSLYQPAM